MELVAGHAASAAADAARIAAGVDVPEARWRSEVESSEGAGLSQLMTARRLVLGMRD